MLGPDLLQLTQASERFVTDPAHSRMFKIDRILTVDQLSWPTSQICYDIRVLLRPQRNLCTDVLLIQ
jgi:hypothetical protein